MDVLRLIAEGIGGPSLSVWRTLEFDFVAAVSHYGEKAVAIGDAKWLERAQGRLRERRAGNEHPDELRGGAIENEA